MPPPETPSYQDGLTALGQLTSTCLNNGVTYITFDGDPTEEAIQKRFSNPAGNPLGSDTQVGWKSGTANMQLANADDVMPRPTFIFLFDSEYWVAGNVGKKVMSGGEVKFSVAVTKVINPVVSSLLSVLGQYKELTLTKDDPMDAFDNTAVNHSGTVTWTSTALPAGLLLNAATGQITGTPTALGETVVKVTATDSETGKAGFSFLAITVEA